jgi:putative DNA methylase
VQAEALAAADRQVTEWGIEHNDQGERADAYCIAWKSSPRAATITFRWRRAGSLGEKSKVVTRWRRAASADFLTPEIVTSCRMPNWLYKEKQRRDGGDSRVSIPFDATRTWSVEALRGPDGLRRWSNDDVVPRPGDVFQERLYCIRWVKTVPGMARRKETRRYAAPDAADLAREAKVLELLRERFAEWQREGFIPSKAIR